MQCHLGTCRATRRCKSAALRRRASSKAADRQETWPCYSLVPASSASARGDDATSPHGRAQPMDKRGRGAADAAGGSAAEVFKVFLKLGVTSFGGPIAHLGYFRDDIVQRRRWLDERSYADLVALGQFLPGPASSEVGIAIG